MQFLITRRMQEKVVSVESRLLEVVLYWNVNQFSLGLESGGGCCREADRVTEPQSVLVVSCRSRSHTSSVSSAGPHPHSVSDCHGHSTLHTRWAITIKYWLSTSTRTAIMAFLGNELLIPNLCLYSFSDPTSLWHGNVPQPNNNVPGPRGGNQHSRHLTWSMMLETQRETSPSCPALRPHRIKLTLLISTLSNKLLFHQDSVIWSLVVKASNFLSAPYPRGPKKCNYSYNICKLTLPPKCKWKYENV